MKKTFIISGVIIILFTTAFTGVRYYLSLHDVTVNLASGVKQVKIFRSGNKSALQTISGSTTLRLQDGRYRAVPEGEHVVSDDIDFNVNGKNQTITVDPDLTPAYLAELLTADLPSITKEVSSQLPLATDQYRITHHQLFGKGEWFGALLEKRVSDPRDIRDYYRIVMKKQDTGWKMVEQPELILTSVEFPGVPVGILRKINVLTP